MSEHSLCVLECSVNNVGCGLASPGRVKVLVWVWADFWLMQSLLSADLLARIQTRTLIEMRALNLIDRQVIVR